MQHHQQQQHALSNRSVFRDLVEQVLFTPVDVQQVFAHIPALFSTGSYLQVRLHFLDTPKAPKTFFSRIKFSRRLKTAEKYGIRLLDPCFS